jgi:hypothetical protein
VLFFYIFGVQEKLYPDLPVLVVIISHNRNLGNSIIQGTGDIALSLIIGEIIGGHVVIINIV